MAREGRSNGRKVLDVDWFACSRQSDQNRGPSTPARKGGAPPLRMTHPIRDSGQKRRANCDLAESWRL